MKTPRANRDEVKTASLAIKVDEEMKKSIDDKARALGTTSASVVRMAIKNYLKEDQ